MQERAGRFALNVAIIVTLLRYMREEPLIRWPGAPSPKRGTIIRGAVNATMGSRCHAVVSQYSVAWLCSLAVIEAEDATEPGPTLDRRGRRARRRRCALEELVAKPLVVSFEVVVLEVFANDLSEVSLAMVSTRKRRGNVMVYSSFAVSGDMACHHCRRRAVTPS